MISLTVAEFTKLIPKYVIQIAEDLEAAGFEAYLVGGSVRDILLGKTPDDFDIATNAYPEQIEKVFPKSIPVGAKFGTIIVVTEDEHGERFDVEVTTYRSESDYVSGRWPSKVDFAKTIEDDLKRRDFTMNAIALNLQNFDEDNVSVENILVDPFLGVRDILNREIKAVGDPVERFSEDGLRSVRGCRLASVLDSSLNKSDEKKFFIEEKTFTAMRETVHVTKHVSVERFRDELLKLLKNSPRPSKGLRLMKEAGILELFIPELLEGININQPQFHVEDVFDHSLRTCDLAEDDIKLAALFHDIGKPRTKSVDEKGVHFYGHDMEGAKMTAEIMRRLRFSNAEIERVTKLVRWHMFYYPSADWRKSNNNETEEVRLTVLRHGQTEDTNEEMTHESRVTGQNDIELIQKGIKQAENVAKYLENSDIDYIISSPLKRAYQTAEVINKSLKLEIKTDPKLMERHFGELQGLTWSEFQKKYPELANHPKNSPMRQSNLPDSESIEEVEKRVQVFLTDTVAKNIGRHLLIVTHTGIYRILKRIDIDGYLKEIVVDKQGDLKHCEYITISYVKDLNNEDTNSKLHGWSDGAIRRLIQNVGGEDAIDQLMKLRIADATANPKSDWDPTELDTLAQRIANVRSKDMALKISDLDITGKDLIENFNIEQGPILGEVLNYLLEQVLEEPLYNKKLDLLRLAKEYISHKQNE